MRFSLHITGIDRWGRLPLFWFSLACLTLLPLLCVKPASAEDIPNRLQRMEIRPKGSYTRLIFKMRSGVDFTISSMAGRRVRVAFMDADGPIYKRFRNYSDANVGGIRFSHRNGELVATFSVSEEFPGIRAFSYADPSVVVVDVGPYMKGEGAGRPLPGRERIWSGAEKLIKEFDPPGKSDIPFAPTMRQALPGTLPEEEKKLFLKGEAALYKGMGTDAEAVFSYFAKKEPPLRGLAAYRLGEARYLLQNYKGALEAFREGERLWPAYLSRPSSTNFYYADSIARLGNFQAGRKAYCRLITATPDKPYAPLLLVRLAELTARQGDTRVALAIYSAVMENFPAHKAALHAEMNMADLDFFRVGPSTYSGLLQVYEHVSSSASGVEIREEALFKAALLEAVYGKAEDAVNGVSRYEKKYSKGAYAGIAAAMKEDLLCDYYRDLHAAGNCPGFLKMAQENRAHLARCLADPEFLPRLWECVTSEGKTRDGMSLFVFLSEREWADGNKPFLLRRIVDSALSLSELPLAERSAREFLERFPRREEARKVSEQLAAVHFLKKDFTAAAMQLSWLLRPKEQAFFAESYYYLGKALATLKRGRDGERAVSAYVGELKRRGIGSPYLADAYLILISTRKEIGDLKGAIGACREGYESVPPELRDMFTYKLGELYRQEGRQSEAKEWWEKTLKEGRDPVWRKMASQGLADMDWREKVGPGVTGRSK